MNKYKPPLLILAVEPKGDVTFPGFLDTHEGSAKHVLENPPYLRYMGWNMLTLDRARIQGNYWEVQNGERKTIRLHRDGSLVAVGYADDSFLGWGKSHEEFLESPELNTLALIEYVYEFTNLYKEILKFLKGVQTVCFKAGFENVTVNDKKLFLIPEIKAPGRFVFTHISGEAQNDFYTEDVVGEVKNGSYRPEQVTLQLIREIFANFGIAPNNIPLVKSDEKGQESIDIEQIKNIR